MRRPIALYLVVLLAVTGCAGPRDRLVPTGIDSANLETEIARKGEETGPITAPPEPSAALKGCWAVAGAVGAACAFTAALAVYAAYAIAKHGI